MSAFTIEKMADGIALLIFDSKEEKVNTFNLTVMTELGEKLDQLRTDSSIKAMLILSGKEDAFIAGADVREIEKITDPAEGYRVAREGQKVFQKIADLPFPVVSVINGACMGGGTEMSLACDYRLATDHPKTSIALPEVTLGIIPGWGGTQRLPRLIGIQRALDIILTGKRLDAVRAYKSGLVDKVIPWQWQKEKALEFITEILKDSGEAVKARRKASGALPLLLEKNPAGRAVLFSQAKKMLLEKTKGQYPAPLAALDVVRKTIGKSLEAGLETEAKVMGDLIITPVCKNLVQIFFRSEAVKKENGTTNTALKGQKISKAAVLGAGVMGGGIAQLFASKQIDCRVKDINNEAVAKAYQQAAYVLQGDVKRRKITPVEFRQTLHRITGTTDYSGFKSAGIVVEAIVENLKVKMDVIAELEKQVGQQTIIASNTSSLSINEMAKALQHKDRFIGLHFFNPVHRMPLVEIIRGSGTSDETVATVFNLSKALGKTPIVVNDGPGFLVNRLLVPYMVEAISLLESGVDLHTIDRTLVKFGMPMGPLELFDEVGIDVAHKVAKILHDFMGSRMAESPILERMITAGRLGKKSGKGFYRYEGHKKLADPETASFIKPSEKISISETDLVHRLIFPMVNEAARCLDENIARSAADVDLGMIFGTGFAPFRGGLLTYAESEGLKNVQKKLQEFEHNYGVRFTPSSAFLKFAEKGSFYEKSSKEKK